jgi:hypothetical protein
MAAMFRCENGFLATFNQQEEVVTILKQVNKYSSRNSMIIEIMF